MRERDYIYIERERNEKRDIISGKSSVETIYVGPIFWEILHPFK